MKANSAQICEIFLTSERTLTRWINEGMPVAYQGGAGQGDESTFAVGEIHRWLLNRATVRAMREKPDARFRRLQATQLEMQIAKTAERLVSADEVETVWTEAVVAARSELLSLPDRLKARLDAMYRVNIDPAAIENELVPALLKLATNPPQIADSGEDEGDEDYMDEPISTEGTT